MSKPVKERRGREREAVKCLEALREVFMFQEKKKKRKIQIGSLRVYMTHLISDDKNVCFGTNECVSICKCIFV